ncbi:MAG: GNAT family N-acetyltransferase [Methanoregula sp.]|nr:GNAT family N-acetyltransferase [Methanoregula sp.]
MNRVTGYTIREIRETDRDRIIEIFNYYITHGFSAYPDAPVPARFFDVLREGAHAFYAVESGGITVGFGIMKPFLPFDTFKRTATVSYFVLPGHTRSGTGTLLISAFIRDAKQMGIGVLLASISSKNHESLQFHNKQGFIECGRLKNVGHKFGELFDVIWMERELTDSSPEEKPGYQTTRK